MAKTASTWHQRDATKAIKAARAGGIRNPELMVMPDGTFIVRSNNSNTPDTDAAEDWKDE